MKKVNLLLAIVAVWGVACQNENVPENNLVSFDNPIVEETHNSFNDLIAEQNGEFSDEEFVKTLTSSVIKRSEALFYFNDGSVRTDPLVDGGQSTDKFLFFDNSEYWACYEPNDFFWENYREIPDKLINGSYPSQWSYDAETNELTVVCCDFYPGQAKIECKGTLLYFDSKQFIIKGGLYPFDCHYLLLPTPPFGSLDAQYGLVRYTFEEGRDEAVEKYSVDLFEYFDSILK